MLLPKCLYFLAQDIPIYKTQSSQNSIIPTKVITIYKVTIRHYNSIPAKPKHISTLVAKSDMVVLAKHIHHKRIKNKIPQKKKTKPANCFYLIEIETIQATTNFQNKTKKHITLKLFQNSPLISPTQKKDRSTAIKPDII